MLEAETGRLCVQVCESSLSSLMRCTSALPFSTLCAPVCMALGSLGLGFVLLSCVKRHNAELKCQHDDMKRIVFHRDKGR